MSHYRAYEDELDALQDQFLSDLYEQFGPQWVEEHAEKLSEEAIKQFRLGRLQSAYTKHPNMANKAIGMWEEMQKLLGKDNRLAALVFGASVIEITIRDLLLHPILSGVVHNEALADVILKLVPRHVGSDAFRKVLFPVLDKVAKIDLTKYKRPGSAKSLWDEYQSIRDDRNRLIHDATRPSNETLATFDAVASEFLQVIFPKVLTSVHLNATGYLMIHEEGVSMAPIEADDSEQTAE